MNPNLIRLPAFPVLEGLKICLRPFDANDITQEYIGWLNNPEVMRFSNQRFRHHDRASCEQYLRGFAASDNLFLAITEKMSGGLVGTMTAYVSTPHGTADIGLLIGNRNLWGKGVGQEAWGLLCRWLLGADIKLRKLTAGTARPNVAMVNIMERFGMRLEAVRYEQELIDGVAVDLLYYACFNQVR